MSLVCSLCHDGVLDGELVASCIECRAVYHCGCREENGGCGTYGCRHVPAPEAQAAPVEAPAVWGSEVKTCPVCYEDIRAAALRCRWCDTVFDSAVPQTTEEYRRNEHSKLCRTRLNRSASWLFIGGLVPLSAPLAIAVGAPFVFTHRAGLASARPMARTMIGFGLGLAVLWVLLGGLAVATG